MGVSYLTPKARPVPAGHLGHGAVALDFIAAGELVVAYGGRCVSRDELELLPRDQESRANIVAMRDIEPGEVLSYDYACSDGTDYDEFECGCGAARCRGKVTGQDWMLPELQLRYRGYFSPYLQARIASLVTVGSGRRAFAY